MFAGFMDRFPEISAKESMVASVTSAGELEEAFVFMELYCEDPGCDCRRVIVQVFSEQDLRARRRRIVATLTYGWEPARFYEDWMSVPLDAGELADLQGPALQRLAPQSERADEMLEHFKSMVGIPEYVDRLKQHYAMFRESVQADTPRAGAPRLNRAQRREARRGRAKPRWVRD